MTRRHSITVEEAIDRQIEHKGRVARLAEVWNGPGRWRLIREYYRDITPAILDGVRLDPYALGMGEYMTPIERAVWSEIRINGLPFYMQYPVGRRFVDFGDPCRKIAIEVDGKDWHTPEKDAQKDRELMAEGWSVFRITGRDAIYGKSPIANVLRYYGIVENDEDEEG